jgi:tetratricopeptide (TPR) repeat protein
MALASYATGDPQRALGLFDKAIRTLEQAHNHIGSAFLKNEYSRTLKTVLQQYAIALRQQGDNSRADAMDQKASAIVVKDNIKDD